MLNEAIGMLLIAYILSRFGFDKIFVKGMQELVNLNITVSSYYVIFFIIGCIGGLYNKLNGRV